MDSNLNKHCHEQFNGFSISHVKQEDMSEDHFKSFQNEAAQEYDFSKIVKEEYGNDDDDDEKKLMEFENEDIRIAKKENEESEETINFGSPIKTEEIHIKIDGENSNLSNFYTRQEKKCTLEESEVQSWAVLEHKKTIYAKSQNDIKKAMDWDHEKCLELIDLYRMRPEIWNPNDKWYHNTIKKHDAWAFIASETKTSVDCIKAKMNSLLSSFRREKNKEDPSVGAGKGRDEIYKSKWFAYKSFAFLMVKNKYRLSLHTAKNKAEESAKIGVSIDNNTTGEEVYIEKNNESFVVNESPEDMDLEPQPQKTFRSDQPAAGYSKDIPDENPPISKNHHTPPRKKIKQSIKENPVQKSDMDRAFQIVQDGSSRDERDIYGEHIAAKLKSYTKYTQAVVQHLCNNILFNADMGEYDNKNMRDRHAAMVSVYPNNCKSRPSSGTSTSYTLQPQSPSFESESENTSTLITDITTS